MVRIFARIVALLAIAAVAAGVYLIVHDNVATMSSTKTHHHHRHAQHHRPRSHGHHTSSKPAFYTVKAGDTLSAIVSRTGVSLATITNLNPSLAPPYNLSTGQKLRLRR
jgi:LysM repeat protein